MRDQKLSDMSENLGALRAMPKESIPNIAFPIPSPWKSPGFGTLGGDTLGDFLGEGIGKAMLGIYSLGIALSAPKFSDISDNF